MLLKLFWIFYMLFSSNNPDPSSNIMMWKRSQYSKSLKSYQYFTQFLALQIRKKDS